MDDREWEAFRQLSSRVDSVEDDVAAMRNVPAQLVELENKLTQRFDDVDRDHKRARQTQEDQTKWVRFLGILATVLAALGAFATPIIVALLS
jgi:hypothetical protein